MSGRVVVLGAGLSGEAAAALLRREGCAVDVLDGAMTFPADGVYDFAVTSPGIPLDHPWQRECRARGVKVISELQLGWDRWRAMGGRALAVTGSKGKSSVVKLVADALGGVPCGNYGRPLCDVVNDHVGRDEARPSQLSNSTTFQLSNFPTFQPFNFSTFQLPWAVVEVSSFQMETTDDFHPDAAALLNLQEDHLDRHGTKETYHALKRKLVEGAHQDRAMVGRAVLSPPGGAVRTTRPTMAAHAFDASGMTDADVPADVRTLFAGSYFDNSVLAPNGAAAVWLMREAGLGDDAIRNAFASFEPLPHRMQIVCERDGVRYIDDSKATSLAALAAGVRMAGRPVRLIAGGLGKGDDAFSLIICLQSTVKKVYLIGCCAERLFDAWHLAVPCEMCGTLEVAVEAASRDARPGEAVLLSPGAASFDQFENFGERGKRFAAIVMKERKNK